ISRQLREPFCSFDSIACFPYSGSGGGMICGGGSCVAKGVVGCRSAWLRSELLIAAIGAAATYSTARTTNVVAKVPSDTSSEKAQSCPRAAYTTTSEITLIAVTTAKY